MKKFNITGICVPQKHYMVKIEKRLAQIKVLIDEGAYFTINRARQYGKTTTLHALYAYLQKDYLVVSLDFQALGDASFQDENSFSITFAAYFLREFRSVYKGNETKLDQALDDLKTVPGEEKDPRRFNL